MDLDAQAAARHLEAWYEGHARDLPWRRVSDPWAILLSEIILQQTRVETGGPAFERLLRQFPTPASMAAASEQEVLRAWAGLGYYRRAHHLHAAAKALVERHHGAVPRTAEDLAALPGIGPYTAEAIRAFAFDEPAAPLDGNVARVVARVTGETGAIDAAAARARLRAATLAMVREGSPRVLAQAIMEVGALVCLPAQPRCDDCPLARACTARREGSTGRIPVLRPKAKPRVERWAFVLVPRDGRVLLEQRGPGLLADFWALPGIRLQRNDAAAPALEDRLRGLGVDAEVGAAGPRQRWVFTHRIWNFAVHPALPRGAAAALSHARWVGAQEVAALPLAQPHRAAIEHCLGLAPPPIAATDVQGPARTGAPAKRSRSPAMRRIG